MALRVLFAGTPSAAAHVLDTVAAQAHSYGYVLAGVLTRKDAPVGRKQVLTASPVAVKAGELNLPVIKANRLDSETLAEIASLKVDIAAVVAYGVLLRQEAISAVPSGWINLHYSLLPAWRGAAPVQACLRAGDTKTGTTVFQIDTGMDTGDVLAQQETAIIPGETAGQVLNRLNKSGAMQLVQVLAQSARAVRDGVSLAGISQEDMTQKTNVTVSYAPKIQRADAQIKWEAPGETIARLICAMNPEPGAWSFVELPGKKNSGQLKIFQAELVSGTTLQPGELSTNGRNVWIGTGDSSILEIVQVQSEGKKVMSAADWIRGFKSLGNHRVDVRMLSHDDRN